MEDEIILGITKRAWKILGLTFALCWAIWIWPVLNDNGILLIPDFLNFILYILGGFSPIFAAIILVKLEDTEQRQKLWNRFKAWRFHPLYYVIAIGFPLLFPLLRMAYFAAAGCTFTFIYPFDFIGTIIMFWIILWGGPISEEPGWRGILYPELMKKHNPIISTIIIWPIHTFWHIPVFLMPKTAGQGAIMVEVVTISIPC
jgi:membrane protease YdiL (CAAX protease family)